MKLWEINEKLERCFKLEDTGEVVDGETGEVLDAEYLDELELEKEELLEGLALFVKNLEAEAEAIKAEKMKLAKRQQSAEGKAESLRAYIARNLNGEKLSTAKVALSFRKSEKVEVEEGAKLPLEYVQLVEKPKLTDIKKALKNGVTVEGCKLVTTNNLQIK